MDVDSEDFWVVLLLQLGCAAENVLAAFWRSAVAGGGVESLPPQFCGLENKFIYWPF